MTPIQALAERETLYSPALVSAFVAQNLPPEWGLAIAYQETRFDPQALNNTGGDRVRGGSRGLCQMSWKTALALGFTGAPDDLFTASVCADLAAKLCAELVRRWKTSSLLDVAAGYNSGKKYASAPASAKAYANNVVKYAAQYKEEAQALALDLAKPASVATV